MIHPNTELRFVDSQIGYGVFASSPIPKGSILYVQDQLEIRVTPELYATLGDASRAAVEKYSFIDPEGIRILSWDIAKYVNHSCSPNSLSTVWGFEIAIRDIEAGEEVTDDYGLFNLDWEMECSCGHKHCRQSIRADQANRLYRKWDREIRSAMSQFALGDQPLLPCMDEQTRVAIYDYLNGNRKYRSVRHLLKPIQSIGEVA